MQSVLVSANTLAPAGLSSPWRWLSRSRRRPAGRESAAQEYRPRRNFLHAFSSATTIRNRPGSSGTVKPRKKVAKAAAFQAQPRQPPSPRWRQSIKAADARIVLVVGRLHGLRARRRADHGLSPNTPSVTRARPHQRLLRLRPRRSFRLARRDRADDRRREAGGGRDHAGRQRPPADADRRRRARRSASEAWNKEYERARHPLRRRRGRQEGAARLWVGMPAFKSASKISSDMLAFNDIYRRVAESASGEFVDVWDGFVDENGAFVSTGPDINGQPVRLRTSDGINLTKAGKRKLAFYTRKAAEASCWARHRPGRRPCRHRGCPLRRTVVPSMPIDRTVPIALDRSRTRRRRRTARPAAAALEGRARPAGEDPSIGRRSLRRPRPAAPTIFRGGAGTPRPTIRPPRRHHRRRQPRAGGRQHDPAAALSSTGRQAPTRPALTLAARSARQDAERPSAPSSIDARRLPALANRPYDQRLAAAHVAGGVQPVDAGPVVAFHWLRHWSSAGCRRPSCSRAPSSLTHAVLEGPGKADGDEGKVGADDEFGAGDRLPPLVDLAAASRR